MRGREEGRESEREWKQECVCVLEETAERIKRQLEEKSVVESRNGIMTGGRSLGDEEKEVFFKGKSRRSDELERRRRKPALVLHSRR